MARCRWCEKGGMFQKVDSVGLCKTCTPSVTAEIEKHSNVIYETMHVYERGQTDAEKLTALDELLASAKTLLAYEDKGLETCNPPAKLVLDEYTDYRRKLAGN